MIFELAHGARACARVQRAVSMIETINGACCACAHAIPVQELMIMKQGHILIHYHNKTNVNN